MNLPASLMSRNFLTMPLIFSDEFQSSSRAVSGKFQWSHLHQCDCSVELSHLAPVKIINIAKVSLIFFHHWIGRIIIIQENYLKQFLNNCFKDCQFEYSIGDPIFSWNFRGVPQFQFTREVSEQLQSSSRAVPEQWPSLM